jgi:hypothetical protein
MWPRPHAATVPATEAEALRRADSLPAYLAARQRCEDLLDQLIFHDPVLGGAARLLGSILDGQARPLTVNAGFASSFDGWELVRKGPANIAWDATEGHAAPGSLAGDGNFAISQQVPVSGGRYTALGFVKITGATGRGSYLDVVVLDAAGKPAGEHYRRRPVFLKPGVWTPVATTIDFPAMRRSWPTVWKEPAAVKIVLSLGPLDAGGKAYVDDCALYAH